MGGVYYYHKDMTKEELREAGDRYMTATKQYSVAAYETAKPYALLAAEKAAEGAKCAYAMLMAKLYPQAEAEVDGSYFEEEEEVEEAASVEDAEDAQEEYAEESEV